jgi:thiol-disulfide isomerase/thioredoxin
MGGYMKKKMRLLAVSAAFFALGLMVSSQAFAQARQAAPPEYKELVAASQIKDAVARLKEFERIKAAYPASQFMVGIDRSILSTRIELAGTLDAVLALQTEFLTKGQGPDRLQNPFVAADQILGHPKLETFNKTEVLNIILKYREDTLKAAGEAGTYQGIPQKQQSAFKSYFVTGFAIPVAQAYLNAGDAAKAVATLDTYKKDGGPSDGIYYYTLAGACEKLGKTREAYDAYLAAAVDSYADAADRAKALYTKINGKADGFEAVLGAKLKELPYHPEPFKAPADWKGKAVLAELFTGSECPPCVGADLGFDGLIESYPAKYLAILEYHLPIPRPDPMMNPATKKRQDYYGVNSTPTVVIDGDKNTPGGGSRGMAEGKYKQYKAGIDSLLGAAPVVALKAKAARAGDIVKVEYDLGNPVDGAEYRIVLVQGEESYKGSNGLAVHKMVVRDIIDLDPATAKKVSFDLAASERAADQYLTEFETTSPRFKGFKFAERHHKIDRTKLAVVLFAQDKGTKKVLNAVAADVK